MFKPAPLSPKNVQGAQLFANREALIEAIGPRKTGKIAEVGVAFGGFSRKLIARYKPEEFHAIDLFKLHEAESVWGQHPSETFGEKTHRQWFEDSMANPGTKLVVAEGDSFDILAQYPDETFDIIYIDGSHYYEDVKRDADAAELKVQRDGLLIFNDYIMFDANIPYGVVQVVNDLIENRGWKVIGLGLHPEMFCDIAIARGSA